MVTPELQKYVDDSRAAGMADEQIVSALLSQGWHISDITAVVGFRKSRIRKIIGFLALLLWIVALFLPAYTNPPSNLNLDQTFVYGYLTFVFGFMGGSLFSFLAWFSNLPWLIALIFFLRKKPLTKFSMFLAGLAFLLSLNALAVTRHVTTEAGHVVLAYPAIGAYVWLSSMLILVIGCILSYRLEKKIK